MGSVGGGREWGESGSGRKWEQQGREEEGGEREGGGGRRREREARVKVREQKGEGRDRGGRECTHTTKQGPPHLSPGAWEMILLFSNRYFSIDALYTQNITHVTQCATSSDKTAGTSKVWSCHDRNRYSPEDQCF